ncbi:MAG: ABC transporter permease [Magnetococcus sp. THC-1_WYH]
MRCDRAGMNHRSLPPLLIRSSMRHFLGHPWMTFLAVFGIALGVAVVTAVDLANQGAMRAMHLTVASLSGQSTHRLVGSAGGIAESLFGNIRWMAGVEQAAPIVEGSALSVAFPDRVLHIMGVDLVADAPFRPHVFQSAEGVDLKFLITRPQTALLSAQTAASLNVKTGDRTQLLIRGKKHAVTIIGVLDTADPLIRQGLADTLIVDVATAQELLDFHGRLTRIDLILTPGAKKPPIPQNLRWVETQSRTQALEGLTESFRLNLSVLSLLALMVGMFIIFNTMTFSVVRRRHLIGLLRAQGVTREELWLQLLGDGLFLGILGTLLGLLMGVALGKGLLVLVVQTINDLYFGLQVTGLSLAPFALVKGAILGVGASLVAAWPAAWEAVSIAPSTALIRSALEVSAGRGLRQAGGWGAVMLAVGGGVLLIPGQNLYAGFAVLGFFILGAALLTPILMLFLVTLFQPIMRRYGGWMGTLALGSVPRNLSRTGVAVAALTVAVATLVGMGILVESFRGTVVRWLDETVSSDIYVATGETTTGAGVDVETLDADLIKTLSQVDGVASVGLGRRLSLDTLGGRVNLFVLDVDWPRFSERWFLEGNAKDLWPRFQQGGILLVSESLAFRRKLVLGSLLEIPTPQGSMTFPVAGVYADFRADTGSITISRAMFANYWGENAMASMGIRVKDGVSVDAVMNRLRQVVGLSSALEIQSNRGLRQASLEIFDRTFAVTRVLRMLSVVVAFFGIWTALMAIQWERTRELAVFRALGMTADELLRMTLLETTIMGIIAGVLAIPVGWLLGVILIDVVNYRSFGWSLRMETSVGVLFQALVIAVPTALIAGLFPAWRMARTPPLEALRETV